MKNLTEGAYKGRKIGITIYTGSSTIAMVMAVTSIDNILCLNLIIELAHGVADVMRTDPEGSPLAVACKVIMPACFVERSITIHLPRQAFLLFD